MTDTVSAAPGVLRYRTLGLVANPFSPPADSAMSVGLSLEVAAAANRLLAALVSAADQDATRPILVSKSTEVPNFYHLRAISHVESVLIKDDDLGLLHAYIQLFMMRRGRVRSTLGVVGERLVFRNFDHTLAGYIAKILDEPDENISSYEALGPERLEQFKQAFLADPVAVTNEYFGAPELERRADLSEVVDLRLSGLESDVDEPEDAPEVDASLGNAPGTGMLLPEELAVDDERAQIVGYLIEYTGAHLSKVLARALRVYRERGLAALSTELKVTKAPRKTLAAVVQLALVTFRKVAIIYDGFDNWSAIAPDMRKTIVGTLSKMRWMLDGNAIFVLLLEKDKVPELEEQFGAGTHVSWDFGGLLAAQNSPDELNSDLIDSWLAAATHPDTHPITLGEDAVLAALADASGGSLERFVAAAEEAVESAAARKAAQLAPEDRDVGLALLEEVT